MTIPTVELKPITTNTKETTADIEALDIPVAQAYLPGSSGDNNSYDRLAPITVVADKPARG
jgi:hypothetical protein